ncbi:hypothetical protein BaRGS_00030201, partial [Batillaria attramentaria]
ERFTGYNVVAKYHPLVSLFFNIDRVGAYTDFTNAVFWVLSQAIILWFSVLGYAVSNTYFVRSPLAAPWTFISYETIYAIIFCHFAFSPLYVSAVELMLRNVRPTNGPESQLAWKGFYPPERVKSYNFCWDIEFDWNMYDALPPPSVDQQKHVEYILSSEGSSMAGYSSGYSTADEITSVPATTRYRLTVDQDLEQERLDTVSVHSSVSAVASRIKEQRRRHRKRRQKWILTERILAVKEKKHVKRINEKKAVDKKGESTETEKEESNNADTEGDKNTSANDSAVAKGKKPAGKPKSAGSTDSGGEGKKTIDQTLKKKKDESASDPGDPEGEDKVQKHQEKRSMADLETPGALPFGSLNDRLLIYTAHATRSLLLGMSPTPSEQFQTGAPPTRKLAKAFFTRSKLVFGTEVSVMAEDEPRPACQFCMWVSELPIRGFHLNEYVFRLVTHIRRTLRSLAACNDEDAVQQVLTVCMHQWTGSLCVRMLREAVNTIKAKGHFVDDLQRVLDQLWELRSNLWYAEIGYKDARLPTIQDLKTKLIEQEQLPRARRRASFESNIFNTIIRHLSGAVSGSVSRRGSYVQPVVRRQTGKVASAAYSRGSTRQSALTGRYTPGTETPVTRPRPGQESSTGRRAQPERQIGGSAQSADELKGNQGSQGVPSGPRRVSFHAADSSDNAKNTSNSVPPGSESGLSPDRDKCNSSLNDPPDAGRGKENGMFQQGHTPGDFISISHSAVWPFSPADNVESAASLRVNPETRPRVLTRNNASLLSPVVHLGDQSEWSLSEETALEVLSESTTMECLDHQSTAACARDMHGEPSCTFHVFDEDSYRHPRQRVSKRQCVQNSAEINICNSSVYSAEENDEQDRNVSAAKPKARQSKEPHRPAAKNASHSRLQEVLEKAFSMSSHESSQQSHISSELNPAVIIALCETLANCADAVCIKTKSLLGDGDCCSCDHRICQVYAAVFSQVGPHVVTVLAFFVPAVLRLLRQVIYNAASWSKLEAAFEDAIRKEMESYINRRTKFVIEKVGLNVDGRYVIRDDEVPIRLFDDRPSTKRIDHYTRAEAYTILIDRHGNRLLINKQGEAILSEMSEPLLAAGASLSQLPVPQKEIRGYLWRPFMWDPFEMDWLPPEYPFTRPVIARVSLKWSPWLPYQGWSQTNVDDGTFDLEMAVDVLTQVCLDKAEEETSKEGDTIIGIKEMLVRITALAGTEIKEEMADGMHVALSIFIRATMVALLECTLPAKEMMSFTNDNVRKGKKRLLVRQARRIKGTSRLQKRFWRHLTESKDVGRFLLNVMTTPWDPDLISAASYKLSDRWFLDESAYEKSSRFLASGLTLANLMTWPRTLLDRKVDTMPALVLDSLSHVLLVRHEMRAAIGVAAAEVLVWAVPYAHETLSRLKGRLRDHEKADYVTETLEVVMNQVMPKLSRRIGKTASRIVQEMMFELTYWREDIYWQEDVSKERKRLKDFEKTETNVEDMQMEDIAPVIRDGRRFVDSIRRDWSSAHAEEILKYVRQTQAAQDRFIGHNIHGLEHQPRHNEWGNGQLSEKSHRELEWIVARETVKRLPYFVTPLFEILFFFLIMDILAYYSSYGGKMPTGIFD